MGQGANGITYVCVRVSDNKQFILKEIGLANKTGKELDSIMKEVELGKRLDHKNIVK